MADAPRLPHLQRPYYQNPDPEQRSPITPQPPKPAQQREVKLSTESLPRPLIRQDEHLGLYTTTGQLPPSPDSLFYVKEQGISNPRFLRFTMNLIPIENSTCNTIGVPLAAI